MPPGPPSRSPKWARKRILIPAAVLTLFIGVGIGAAGGDETEKTSADAKPQPTVTVTETAAAAKPAKDESKPAPTVTVTKTVKPKADDKPADPPEEEASAGEVVFKVWGSAPSGVDINYGSDTDSRSGKGLPFEKTLKLDDEALYYTVNAQLMGGGDVNCSVTVNGETKKGHASGDYNICTAQVNGGLLDGWG
ncbi:hypothetical protein ABZ400_02435 [Streptomyces sp. NPDC005897]|uniref:hypothetical protein n=1 Tax=Streptomyces sp. NPDC005897 TaxID=3157081 RepID=UPI0033DA04BC